MKKFKKDFYIEIENAKHSKEVQLELFKKKFYWNSRENKVMFTDKKYLFGYIDDGSIKFAKEEHFNPDAEHGYRKLTLNDLIDYDKINIERYVFENKRVAIIDKDRVIVGCSIFKHEEILELVDLINNVKNKK